MNSLINKIEYGCRNETVKLLNTSYSHAILYRHMEGSLAMRIADRGDVSFAELRRLIYVMCKSNMSSRAVEGQLSSIKQWSDIQFSVCHRVADSL